MLEVRITVEPADSNGDYQVTLTERNPATGEFINPISGVTTADRFNNGFHDVTIAGGQVLTPAAILTSYASGRGGRADELQNAGATGDVLYRLIAPGAVGERWRELREQDEYGVLPRVATLLELKDPQWADLPWEMVREAGVPLFRDVNQTMGHAIPGGRASIPAHTWPVRMLVVVGCRPLGDAKIGWEEELHAIEEAASEFSVRLDLHVVRLAEIPSDPKLSIETIKTKLEEVRPHIFHFIGHGSTDDGGTLFIADSEMVSNPWSLASLNLCLRALKVKPRIVVLNACKGADRGGDLMLSSTASAFINSNCAAVIAMRGDVRGRAATIFAKTFYRTLAREGIEQLDKGYAGALAAIADDYGEESRSWTLPRIFYARSVAEVFPVAEEQRPCCSFLRAIDEHPDLEDLRPFVNQLKQRREVFYEPGHEDPSPGSRDFRNSWFADSTRKRRAMLVTGSSNSGKSWFLRATTYMAKLEGYTTFYCDFRGDELYPQTKDFKYLLNTLLRAAPENRKLFEGRFEGLDHPGAHLSDFVKAAESFLDPQADPPATLSGDEDVRGAIMGKLLAGLRSLSSPQAGHRLFLAFDNIDGPGGIESADWAPVVDALIKPLSFEAKSRIRIAVAVNPESLAEYHFDNRKDYFTPASLGLLPKQEYLRLIRSYCFRLPALKPPARQVVEAMAPPGDWALSHLADSYGVGVFVNGKLP